MTYNEDAWRAYVLSYDVDVSQEDVEEELYIIRQDMKHRMVYEQMSGGEIHPFLENELEEQKDDLIKAAIFEVKEPLVLKDLTEKLNIEVTYEELLAEAEAIAKRQSSTLDELRRFFGDDFALLERDVRESKIREWACEQ